ncbi:MAG TPA: zinc ribbon domain-containing protein [Solirubrobacteraceae bacterium]|nr:zinc ribbon domain-containing protein [Solirubrobacteraceae bacterium]
MDQTSGTNPTDAPPSQGPPQSQPAEAPVADQPGFRSRGRARRRARFLRRARELAYRDLGGLVYNLHRFGQRNDTLVLAKLSTLSHIDGELRTIESALAERSPVTVLREAGITACPRCAAIHGSEDRYCPNCGLPMSRHADLPVAGAPAGDAAGVAPQPPATAPPQTQSFPALTQPQPAQRPAPTQSATAQHAVAGQSPLPAPTGRSPEPPGGHRAEQTGSGPTGPEENTEIIRPQAPGS